MPRRVPPGGSASPCQPGIPYAPCKALELDVDEVIVDLEDSAASTVKA